MFPTPGLAFYPQWQQATARTNHSRLTTFPFLIVTRRIKQETTIAKADLKAFDKVCKREM